MSSIRKAGSGFVDALDDFDRRSEGRFARIEARLDQLATGQEALARNQDTMSRSQDAQSRQMELLMPLVQNLAGRMQELNDILRPALRFGPPRPAE